MPAAAEEPGAVELPPHLLLALDFATAKKIIHTQTGQSSQGQLDAFPGCLLEGFLGLVRGFLVGFLVHWSQYVPFETARGRE